MNRNRIEQILTNARESVKILETQAKESVKMIEAAKIFENMQKQGQKLSKDHLVKNLRKLGIATKDDVRVLNDRIDDLASELRAQMSKMNRRDRSGKDSKES